MKDVIWRTIELMMEVYPSIPPEAAKAVDMKAREEFGGQRLEIPKKFHATRGPGRSTIPRATAEAVIRDVLAEPDTSTDVITRRHGISRSSLYRLLKRS